MDKSYTLIAYKPESCEYARGVLYESFLPGFRLHVGLTLEEALDTRNEILLINTELNSVEAGYCVYILYLNYPFYWGKVNKIENILNIYKDPIALQKFIDFRDIFLPKYDEKFKALYAARQNELKLKREERDRQLLEEEAAEQELRDKEEYERLKKRFET